MNTQQTSGGLSGPPQISVIMPVYNGVEFMRKSLPPLIAMQERGEVLEVIVVDDSSTDDTPQLAARMGARVIPSGGRLGPGAARNMAVLEARGNVVWFVDADVIVHDDAVRYINEGFAQPGVVAVFGSYDDRPPARNFLSQYKNLVHHFYHHRGRRVASTFWSGCGVVIREAFLAVGGFDTEMFKRPSIEDIELGYRLRHAGGTILLMPELQGTHLKVWRLLNLLHTEIFCRAIPWSRLLVAQPEMTDDLNVSSLERLRALLAGLFLLLIPVVFVGLLPWWGMLAGLVVITLANHELAGLFLRRKGVLFALAALLFHQLYYVYSGAAFAYSWLEAKLGHGLPAAGQKG